MTETAPLSDLWRLRGAGGFFIIILFCVGEWVEEAE
jgi:hypothetical protein